MHYPMLNSTSANLINLNSMLNYDPQAAQMNYMAGIQQPVFHNTNPFLVNSQPHNGFNQNFYHSNHGN
jgi:hypothetical protein